MSPIAFVFPSHCVEDNDGECLIRRFYKVTTRRKRKCKSWVVSRIPGQFPLKGSQISSLSRTRGVLVPGCFALGKVGLQLPVALSLVQSAGIAVLGGIPPRAGLGPVNVNSATDQWEKTPAGIWTSLGPTGGAQAWLFFLINNK